MSTTITSTRRAEHTTSTTSRRESATRTISSEETSEPTTLQRQFSLIQLDSVAPAPSATVQDPSEDTPDATTTSFMSSATCSSDSDCGSDKICSKGTCANMMDAAPFGPAGGSSLAPTSHMSTASAIGVGVGLVGLILLLFGLGIWFWRRRGRKPLNESIEAPLPNRNRSASSATDQKTLVASLPNSPQQANFREQQDEMRTAAFAQLVTSNKIHDHSRTEKEKFAFEGQQSREETSPRSPLSNEKTLPLPPTDMPLPPPPTEEKRYAINVNINKSMIFDDAMFNVARPNRDSEVSRDRMPKYRFEEYLPPVARTPPLSIQQYKFSQRKSEYEMEPYPRKDSSVTNILTGDEEDAEVRVGRQKSLKILDDEPPQLPLPELLPPPSPSFSFKSYDWYQDIIGTEQTNAEDAIYKTSTPSIPDRNPARTPTQVTFGAALSSNPPDVDRGLLPPPLSPGRSSHLHPNTAALSSSSTLASPTSPNFRLSPTVYTMPSRPPKAQPMRASLQSTMTQNTHLSRSWLPDDGLYLPEEGTHDSYMMFKRQLDDDSRPTSYSPLS